MVSFDPRLAVIAAIAGVFWALGSGAEWLLGLQGSMLRTRLTGLGLLVGAGCYGVAALREGRRLSHDVSGILWGGSVLFGAAMLLPRPLFVGVVLLGVALLVLPRRALRGLGRIVGAFARKIGRH